MEHNNFLALRVKSLMENMSKRGFADKCGISEGVVRKILRGDGAKLTTIEKIATAYNHKLWWFYPNGDKIRDSRAEGRDGPPPAHIDNEPPSRPSGLEAGDKDTVDGENPDTDAPSSTAQGTDRKSVGARIREVRDAMPVEEFAEIGGVDPSSIESYEDGSLPPPLEFIINIINYFGASYEWFLSGRWGDPKKYSNGLEGTGYTGAPVTRAGKLDVEQKESEIGEKLTPSVKDELIKMTSEVLDSETVYRPALVSNIRAFHHGVKGELQMVKLESDMQEMKAQMSRIEEILLTFTGSAPVMNEKKRASNGC